MFLCISGELLMMCEMVFLDILDRCVMLLIVVVLFLVNLCGDGLVLLCNDMLF